MRIVIALFNQSKDIKASSNLTMSQLLIYFRNSGDPTATGTRRLMVRHRTVWFFWMSCQNTLLGEPTFGNRQGDK